MGNKLRVISLWVTILWVASYGQQVYGWQGYLIVHTCPCFIIFRLISISFYNKNRHWWKFLNQLLINQQIQKQMFVSGLTIERIKISQQKRVQISKNKYIQRPQSSQLHQIHEANKKSNLDIKAKYLAKQLIGEGKECQKKRKQRHSSSNKMSATAQLARKNFSSNKDLSHENQKDRNQNKLSLKEIRQFNSTNKNANEQIGRKANRRRLQLGYRKNQGQTMDNSSAKLVLFEQIQKQKITKYFRYYPMIVIQSCLKRQAFMSSLSQTGDIQVFNTPKISKKSTKKSQPLIDLYQPWNKLIKIANLRGKYKFREKFNFNYSAQLKALSFKRKQAKKKKQSESSSSDDDKKEKCRDMDTWKKTMGVQGAKVFIVKGKYTDFRNALLQRGWFQNPDKHSTFFDLKWTTKVNDITFQSLKANQIVNHFNNNACLTSKYGICKSLRSIMYSEEVDIDKFFPKAFDLIDCSDFENFLQIYKWVYYQAVLKSFVKDEKDFKIQAVRIAYVVLSRRLAKSETLIKNTVLQSYFVSSVEEWLAINDEQRQTYDQFNQVFQAWGITQSNKDSLKLKVEELLLKLKRHQPQYDLNGSNNIWIVKPAFLSRGRGIKCLSKLNDILNYSMGKQTQYVVQKYIQNPLIINKKKFDIRQWVLVEDYNPPKIWIYGQFYCRFCLEQYDQTKIANKFAHLTNNSIQKYNKNMSAAQLKQCLRNSMWTQQQLNKFIDGNYPQGSSKLILQKMKQIVVSTILSTTDQVYGRRNSFQLIGYDFMIDDRLNPWLIQINTSPAMDYSTPVTARLVKMVLQDVAKIVIDGKKKKTKRKTAGLFKCIYNGESQFISKHYNILQRNTRQQQDQQ